MSHEETSNYIVVKNKVETGEVVMEAVMVAVMEAVMVAVMEVVMVAVMAGEETAVEEVMEAVLVGEETAGEETGEVVMEAVMAGEERAVVMEAVAEKAEKRVVTWVELEGTVVEKHSHNKIPQSRFVGIFHGCLMVRTNTDNDNCSSHKHMLTL
jgi:hypothetical protein